MFLGALSASAAPYAEGALLDVIRGMSEGSWKRVNTNSYASAWPPNSLRPIYGSGVSVPSKIIGAWSSFAWDSNRGDLILYGGGHANYSGNDVYRWRSRTLQWERASLSSEVEFVGSNTWNAIDGADSAPTSAHTYDNSLFLPLADRFLTFGGAIHNTGGAYTKPSEENPGILRTTGPYFFDPSKADPDKVGGTTGSHVQRVAPFPEIEGGEMWQNRDIHKHLSSSLLPKSHVNGCTAYSGKSDGHDVVYVAARTNASATALELYRYEVLDANAPQFDTMTRIGRYWSGPSGQTTCAHDPVVDIVLRTGSNASPLFYWNLATVGGSNYENRVAVDGQVKELVDELNAIGRSITDCAMDYDPNGGRYVLWCGSGRLWSIEAPYPVATTGWRVVGMDPATGDQPPNAVGTGILGKWKYIPGFDVFIGLVDINAGDIWVYKPLDWVEPSGDGSGDPDPGPGPGDGDPPPDPSNVGPTVVLSSPGSGTEATVGVPVVLSADAVDEDGTIVEVVFRVSGTVVGTATAAPYSLEWTPTAAGSFEVTAEAFDDDGASALSAVAHVTVRVAAEPPAPGESGTVVIQRAEGSDFKTADTYLSSYHKSSNFGGSAKLSMLKTTYIPLLRFAIFASEGGPVPDGAQITSAKLQLYKGSYDAVIGVHAMKMPWEEKEATWNQRRAGEPWHVAGAAGVGTDYEAIEDARLAAGWDAGWMSFDLTGRVQKMSTGESPNHGWRTVWISGNYNALSLNASELATPAGNRPKLEIEWVKSSGGDSGDPDPGVPDPANVAPQVVLSSPGNGTEVEFGTPIVLSADAVDEDGTIVEVVFRVSGTVVGTATAAPYSLEWTPTAAGSFEVTAEAFDDDGASALSAVAHVTVRVAAEPPAPGESGTVVIQRAEGSDFKTADTYLSSYHKSSNFGGSAKLSMLKTTYIPLLRFAIFASEGGPVPDGAQITSAKLQLYKGSYDAVIGVHAMKMPWEEKEATWNQRRAGEPWHVAGAAGVGTDYEAIEDARLAAGWDAGWMSFDLTGRVQKMSTSESPNHGWRTVWISGNYNALSLNASELATPAGNRPRLEIEWLMPEQD